MTEADELSKLQALVKAQDRTAEQLRKQLQQAQNQLQAHQTGFALARRGSASSNAAHLHHAQELELASLRAGLERAQHRVRDLEQSISWRLTAPLRLLGKALAKR